MPPQKPNWISAYFSAPLLLFDYAERAALLAVGYPLRLLGHGATKLGQAAIDRAHEPE